MKVIVDHDVDTSMVKALDCVGWVLQFEMPRSREGLKSAVFTVEDYRVFMKRNKTHVRFFVNKLPPF